VEGGEQEPDNPFFDLVLVDFMKIQEQLEEDIFSPEEAYQELVEAYWSAVTSGMSPDEEELKGMIFAFVQEQELDLDEAAVFWLEVEAAEMARLAEKQEQAQTVTGGETSLDDETPPQQAAS